MGVKKGGVPPMLTEVNVEMHSVQICSSTASSSEGRHRDDDDISDISAFTRAIDIDQLPLQAEDRRSSSSRFKIFPPLFLFVLCLALLLLAIEMARDNMNGKPLTGGILVPNAQVSGSDEADGAGETTQQTSTNRGKIIEFTVANLNTNTNNCTHDREKHTLQCIPQHNESTNKFRVQLHPEWAPVGVERFESLTQSNFWTNVKVFRIVPNFVSQFGLSSDPEIQKVWNSMGPIPDDPVVTSNVRGTVSFATSGRDTRTTQLFINTADNFGLDRQGFAPIGKVMPPGEEYGGMEVVDEFYAGYGEEPNQGEIREFGNEYLDESFPLLTYFVKAEVVQGDIFHR